MSNARQRGDARRAYEEVIDQSPVRASAGVRARPHG